MIINLIIISLLQSGSWLIRKKIINIKKMNNKSIIVAESVLISIILFSYIFMTENAKEIKKDLNQWIVSKSISHTLILITFQLSVDSRSVITI